MKKTATLIRAGLPGWQGYANLYRLSPFYNGHKYVVASAVTQHVTETLVFPSDGAGRVDSFGELGGARGVANHAAALADLGYEVTV